MKQQKVQALTSAEVSEILALQKWATYSQEYPIRYACTLNGALVQVDSFGIDNLPKLDALVVFGGYPRIVKYAGEIIMKHRRQYPEPEHKAPEIILLGSAPSTGQKIPGTSEALLYAQLLVSLGFDEAYIRRNLLKEALVYGGKIAELKQIICGSERLSKLDCPRIGLLTEAGHSLSAVQKFAFAMRDVHFLAFETPVAQLCDRLFDVDSLTSGYGVDIVVGNVLSCFTDWNNGRFPLPQEKQNSFPSREGAFSVVRKYFMKGYAFCLQHPEQWELIGVSKVDALPLVNSRKIEITGCDLDGNKAGNGWESSSAAYLRYQMNTMVNGILDRWFKTGKYPY